MQAASGVATIAKRTKYPLPSSKSSRLFMSSRLKARQMTTESKDTTQYEAARPLQTLFERLSSIPNVDEATNSPFENEHIKAALKLMNQITLEEIGLTLDYFSELTQSQSMTIAETPYFDIAAFILPKGYSIPLHDHPHMTVCSKVLAGEVQIRSFSGVAVSESGDVKAILEFDAQKSRSDSSWLLTPNEGNYHELCALEDSVMLDVLLPPYHDHERPCKFYFAKKVDDYSNYVLRPMRMQYFHRVKLPNNVPYIGYRPSVTS